MEEDVTEINKSSKVAQSIININKNPHGKVKK